MSIDISNYTYEEPTDGNFKPLPKGDYPFIVVDVLKWEESSNGVPYLPLELEILDENGKGIKKVRESLFFSEKAKFRIDQFIKCIKGSMKAGTKIDFSDPSFLKYKEGFCTLGQKKGDKNPDHIFNEVTAWIFEKPAAKTETPAEPKDEDPF